MTGQAAAAVVAVTAALSAGGLEVYTLDSTAAPTGPGAIVGVPQVYAQDGLGRCAVFTFQVPVMLLAATTAALPELVTLLDVALDALAAAGLQVTAGQPATFDLSADAQAAGYDLTVTT